MKALRAVDPTTESFHPVYVVWEITLRCDQPCTHCGSRAADVRPNELTTAECLDVARQLGEAGTRECVLIGGEAYLHPGFLEIIRALKEHGVRPIMTTGGRGISEALAKQMAEAGLFSVSVSIDGLEGSHDLMRAARGSFKSATNALRFLKAAGVKIAANTNLNRFNQADLEALYEHLKGEGIQSWQIQITTPLGRAADRPEMVLQPYDLLNVVPRVAALKEKARADGILVMPGNNLGYFGPEEVLLRTADPKNESHWMGCQAGKYVMGIESDGAVKGCPSLQTEAYVGGHLRQKSVREIWEHAPELSFTRNRTLEDLWGFCRTCPFAADCMGGCSFTAHAVLGRPGNNPYCHFRARTLAKKGLRERLVPSKPAPGRPFDNGLFEVVTEPINAPDERPVVPAHMLKIRRWSNRE